ncbi:MAG: recombinase family protein [Lachnospiraceae bacterium]|nr:recombinase family protein [Lachnospiraceae bacterium]
MKTFGYVRVSTREQNEVWQLIAMEEFGVPSENIYLDKQSGKDFNRPKYRKLLSMLHKDDVLVVKSIDRLGRNYDDILEQWRIITKEKEAAIVVLDMPLLDTRSNRDLTGTLIADIVLQLLSYVAQTESTDSAEVYCFAAAQIKKALDITVKLGGRGYVFWGGREGYETLLNTDVKLEQANIANLMRMAAEYGRSIGFKGDFLIEPKPKEPMKHQYDFDAATAIGFLRQYGLDKDFKLNIEANHATLAGHTFQHELRISAINGMLGSIDANQGDMLLGWDPDEFPFNVYDTTLAMYEVLKAGGINGGFNFDSKNRRPSNTFEDMFHAYILGMDTFALGLIKAAAMIEDGRIDAFVK